MYSTKFEEDILCTEDRQFKVNRLQNETHNLLNSFLNGSLLTRRSLYLYPFIKEYQREKVVKALDRIGHALRGLGEHGNANVKDVLLQIERCRFLKRINAKRLSQILAELYSVLRALVIDGAKTNEVKIRNSTVFDRQRYETDDRNYLRPIVTLQQHIATHLSPFLYGAYIHGSFATRDYVEGASDLDTLLILKETAVLHANSLVEAEKKIVPTLKYFYRIDPLQHHGHMVFTEVDMKYYPQSYFPFVVFNYAVRILGPEIMTFHERDSAWECKNLLQGMLSNGNSQQLRQAVANFYGLKYFLAIVQLIPTVFLQAQGRFYYKKHSFKAIREQNDGISWDILDKATWIRNNWIKHEFKAISLFAKIAFNPFFISLAYRKLHRRPPQYMVAALGDRFLDEYFEFCDSLKDRACL